MKPTVVQAPPSLSAEQLERMRWGTYGLWRGVEVIGFYGLGVMYGYKKRDGTPAWETVRTQRSTVAGFPPPRFIVVHSGRRHYLFDAVVMRRFGQQTGRLAPDGTTPQRLRPVRGKTKQRPA